MKILILAKQYMGRVLISYVVALFLISCSSKEVDLNIDSTAWKSDLNGCKGERLKLKAQAEEIRLQLVGLHERDIRKVLGKPDAQQLLGSSQEIYIYYISGAPKCAKNPTRASAPKEALTVRMDALGNVREATMLRD